MTATRIRIALCALGILSLALAASAHTLAAEAAPRPNIIFILADDLGYGDLGCYGQQRIRTPRIDRLAAQGTRFTQCYAGSTVCAPSRCALMTGLHTGHARVRGNANVPLEPADVTVAEVLHDAGYVTGIIGKWGLGEPDTSGVPNRQGFDTWFGYLNQGHAHDYYPTYLWENETRYELPGNQAGKKEQYSADLFAARALDFIRAQRNQTFFLYLALTQPHANNELGRQTGNGMEVPDNAPYAGEPWPAPQKNHAAMITRLDRTVGQVVDLVDELGLGEKTLILFSSDNGPHREGGADPRFFGSSGPLRGIKRDLTEGGIRVPMIARWPGHVPAGATSDAVWAFWDFLPTAAELAGAPVPPGIDGRSAVPPLLGQKAAEHEPLYWEFHERGSRQALRKGRWKAIRTWPAGGTELYDLDADPAESRDLADKHPEIVADLVRQLDTARNPSPHWPLRALD